MLRHVLAALLSISLAGLLIPRRWSLLPWGRAGEGPPVRLLSSRELSQYDGQRGSRGLYVALLGHVFDVNKGHRHYGPGGAYHCMAGKDASLAFVTGDFSESGQTDDVSSLSPLQVVALYDWLAFYQRDYQAVGLVVGRFYGEGGEPTEALLQVEARLAEGQRLRERSEAQRSRFPSCNSEWSSTRGGGRVWCSTKSGGVARTWTGVPRKLFSPGADGVRCVCVEKPSEAEDDPHLQEYEGCPPQADSCSVGEE